MITRNGSEIVVGRSEFQVENQRKTMAITNQAITLYSYTHEDNLYLHIIDNALSPADSTVLETSLLLIRYDYTFDVLRQSELSRITLRKEILMNTNSKRRSTQVVLILGQCI